MITVDELLDTYPDIDVYKFIEDEKEIDLEDYNGYEVIYIENYNGGVNLHVYKFDE